MKRLTEKSVSGLQRSDTEYQKNDDGSFKALSSSYKVFLKDETAVTLPENKQGKLAGGITIIVPDLTQVQVDGKTAALPGSILVTPPGGTRLTLADNSTIDLQPESKAALKQAISINLPKGTVVISDNTQIKFVDGTLAALPANTEVTLLGSKPRPELYDETFFKPQYKPSELVRLPYPVKELDFTSGGAYSVYNWELFYHIPFTIATHLSKNQRFTEAQRWFHYIFDPTDDSDGPTPERFWKVRPFQYTDVRFIEEILINLSTAADKILWEETFNCIEAWKDAPFRPHFVARYRQTAYMFKTVMAYLDNLIAWGDSLFRQYTGRASTRQHRSISSPLISWVHALRPFRRKVLCGRGLYANLKKDLDLFGNALLEMEPEIPFDYAPHPGNISDSDGSLTLDSLGKMLYFCVPRNDRLMGYWDTVAERLYNIHNSLNIMGIFQRVPLWEPPIDPALLARAAAAGLDISAIVSGASQPLPLVRFQLLVQKAVEICQEVKSLGNNLLSAIEKEDNEALAVLRAKHERVVMEMVEHVKYGQLQEAIKSKEGLLQSMTLAIQRYTYYEKQLGKKTDEIGKTIPELDELDKDSLEKMKFTAQEPNMALREIEVDIAQDLEASGGKIISSQEQEELKKTKNAQIAQDTAVGLDTLAAVWRLMPEFGIDIMPFGAGGDAKFGGEDIAEIMRTLASVSRGLAARFNYDAGMAAKIGTYARREQDWAFQSNLAAGEITQIFKQLRTAQIREVIAEWELKNHRQQMKHAEEIDQFLKGEEVSIGDNKHRKTSIQSFYTWMKREVRGLYGQCFQFAFDIAKKAERALQHELGDTSLSFLQFGYLAGKEGLLAGEKLHLDIKRMEMAYHDLNQREYELTKHVSLLQVNPIALIQLRATGRCTVSLPEELFDMDCPGHYFRRIKSAGVSVPCVTGPYTSVNCTLSLLKSTIRKSQLVGDGYARMDANDRRFEDYFGSMQSIVTSTAQNDSGLFETNLKDERYLPFEGSGVVSEWQLELPADVRQFDYDTISDVILHLRYTAREGGSFLRNAAVANLKTRIEEAQAAGSVRLFCVRQEFPTEWANFTSVEIKEEIKTAELKINLGKEHYPYWSQGRLQSVKRFDVFAKTSKTKIDITEKKDASGNKDTLVKDNSLGDILSTKLGNIAPLNKPDGKLTLYFTENRIEDLWLGVTLGQVKLKLLI